MGEQGSAAEKGPDAVQGGVSVEECEDMIQQSLKTPTVKFLRERMSKAGCLVGRDLIRAVTCDKHITGGYVPGEDIIVCRNHMRSQDDVNQVVKHKLINVYDNCRAANLNWANCAHHACSEIRANHLSGDYHYKRELLRGNMKIRGHEQECVRRRVLKAVAANPHCSKVEQAMQWMPFGTSVTRIHSSMILSLWCSGLHWLGNRSSYVPSMLSSPVVDI